MAPFLCVGLVEIQNTITSPAWTLKFLLCKYHRMLKLNFYSSINRNKYGFGWRIVYEEDFFFYVICLCKAAPLEPRPQNGFNIPYIREGEGKKKITSEDFGIIPIKSERGQERLVWTRSILAPFSFNVQ